MAPRGLVVFDLDGTLLRGKTVCEVLAEPLGKLDRMREIEKYKTENELRKARYEIADWYSSSTHQQLLSYLKGALIAPGVEAGISRLQASGIEVAIASITWNVAVEWFASKWKIRKTLGTSHNDDGTIDHVWGRDKAIWIKELNDELKIPLGRLSAVGDSNGDVEMLTIADLSFFVGENFPLGLEARHIPNADIGLIADSIIQAWS